MKLYVWNRPYGVPYGSSCAYAIAADENEARALIMSAKVSQYGHEPDAMAQQDMDVLGPPDRVCDLPYAEIYEWSE